MELVKTNSKIKMANSIETVFTSPNKNVFTGHILFGVGVGGGGR